MVPSLLVDQDRQLQIPDLHSKQYQIKLFKGKPHLIFQDFKEKQSHVVRTTSLEREANALDDSIRVARTIFDTDSSECVNFDTYFARQFQGLAEEMQQVTTKIHDIYNSFCPTAGITCWVCLSAGFRHGV